MSDGAQISMQDGRVSKALGWFWGIVGMAITGSILLAANNLYQLNITVARGVANDALSESRYQDHEARLRQMEKSMSEVEGKVFRGVPGYSDGN